MQNKSFPTASGCLSLWEVFGSSCQNPFDLQRLTEKTWTSQIVWTGSKANYWHPRECGPFSNSFRTWRINLCICAPKFLHHSKPNMTFDLSRRPIAAGAWEVCAEYPYPVLESHSLCTFLAILPISIIRGVPLMHQGLWAMKGKTFSTQMSSNMLEGYMSEPGDIINDISTTLWNSLRHHRNINCNWGMTTIWQVLVCLCLAFNSCHHTF
jgi:hypothetical protein